MEDNVRVDLGGVFAKDIMVARIKTYRCFAYDVCEIAYGWLIQLQESLQSNANVVKKKLAHNSKSSY